MFIRTREIEFPHDAATEIFRVRVIRSSQNSDAGVLLEIGSAEVVGGRVVQAGVVGSQRLQQRIRLR